MVFIANPDGADLELKRGDRLGALVPAAAQTRSCQLCGFVDTDAFVNDLTMCDFCGTLLPAGPIACRGPPLRRMFGMQGSSPLGLRQ